MSKKTFTLLSVLCSLLSHFVWADCQSTENPGYDQYSTGKYSYECNVTNVCLGQKYEWKYWNFDTSKQVVAKHDMAKYPDLALVESEYPTFEDIREIYLNTQDMIYSCAEIKSKYVLNKQLLDNYTLTPASRKYLESLNAQLEKEQEGKECLTFREDDKIYNYRDLLDSLQYEECVYFSYLWYYKSFGENTIWLVAQWATRATDIVKKHAAFQEAISWEYDTAREAFDEAIVLYENFHKTYSTHVLLQLVYIEAQQHKSTLSKFLHGFKQFINLAVGAQGSEKTQ